MVDKVLKLYSGIGDSIYLNPIVAAFVKKHESDTVYVETPFPQFYRHLGNVKFIHPNIPWRTQTKMMRSVPQDWWVREMPKDLYVPTSHRPVPQPGYPLNHGHRINLQGLKPGVLTTFYYSGETLARRNIIQGFEEQAGIKLPDPLTFPMPTFGKMSIKIPEGKRVAVIRPPTDRAEWHTPARQCDPQYTNIATQMLRNADYYTVSVADTEPTKEWVVGPPPQADLILHKGELGIEPLMALIEHCDILVGGIGWIVPAGLAYGCNMFMVFGGRGGYDNYGNITDERIDMTRVGYALPRNFCGCTIATHACNKHIDDFEQTFGKYLEKIHALPPREVSVRHDAGSYRPQLSDPPQSEPADLHPSRITLPAPSRKQVHKTASRIPGIRPRKV